MVRFTRARRELLAEKFGDLANFAVAGLVFGQAVEQDSFSPLIGALGIVIWVGLLGFSLALKGGRR
jgi:hypothetical protein